MAHNYGDTIMDHWALWLTIVFGVVAILGTNLYMAHLLGEARESTKAIMQGQEHIAELTAEVLRRTRP
jgi:hypothetical protein